MAKHLLVMHAVDGCRELVKAARQASILDPQAEFVAIVPAAASPFELLVEPSASPTRIAARRARRLHQELVGAGLNVGAVRMANFDPQRAVDDALRFSQYSSVVIASPRRPLLHAIGWDLACRVAHRFPQVRVVHATSVGPPDASAVPTQAPA